MSASPGDPQPVFDLIAGSARMLCDGSYAGLFDMMGLGAFAGDVHRRAMIGHDRTPGGLSAALPHGAGTRSSHRWRAILDQQIDPYPR